MDVIEGIDEAPAWVGAPNVWGDRLGVSFGEGEVVAAVESFDDVCLRARLRLLDERGRALEAERAVVLAELDRRGVFRRDGQFSLVAFLRCSVVWSRAECRDRPQLARLVEAYPSVGEYLWEGWLSVGSAVALARTFANPRTKEAFDHACGTLLNQASRMECDDLVGWLAEWSAAADADGAHRDREASHEGRAASLTEFAGVGTLVAQWGDLDTALNQAVFDRFVQAEWDADWAFTVAEHGDKASATLMPRTEAQRRADALSAIFRRAGSVERGKAPRIVTNIHVDFGTWCELMAREGLFPTDTSLVSGDRLATQVRCATGDGLVVDPVALLRACLENWVRFVIVNDQGVPITMGRTRRLFSGAGREAVMLLSSRCTQPGCRVRSSHCEADHLVEWSSGGMTDPDNGGPRCRRHNRLRNQGFTVTRDRFGWHTFRPDGTEIC